MCNDYERPLLAGRPPSREMAAASPAQLHLGLLGNLQRVVDLGSEIPDGAFELPVSEQALHRAEILGRRWINVALVRRSE